MNNSCHIHKMSLLDVSAVALLEQELFSDPWSEGTWKKAVTNIRDLYLVAELNGQTVGYLAAQLVLDEGELLRIAVASNTWGRGIGKQLLAELLLETPETLVWNLEVREGNQAAISLYKKFGFLPVGLRKEYYHNPKENALLMQLDERSFTRM